MSESEAPSHPPSSVPASEPGRYVELGGVRLHVVERGSGPLAVLLHGFPEFWWGWRYQIPTLVEGGLHVVAPDLRGYNLSDRPPTGYDIDTLTLDVRNLVRALGQERCHLVGHDWGGLIAWFAAMRFPELVERLVILNAPHPAAYLREIRGPEQLARSWYIGLFVIPGVSEWLLSLRDHEAIMKIFQASRTGPEPFSDADLAVYREVWRQPGMLSAALEYYRQLFLLGRGGMRRRIRRIEIPTQIIWGLRDVALSPALLNGLERWVPDLEIARIPDVGHWVQHEAAAEVNQRLLGFLTREHGRPTEPRL